MIRAVIFLLIMLCGASEAGARKPRIAKPLKKVHTDTIAIPDEIFFTPEAVEAPAEQVSAAEPIVEYTETVKPVKKKKTKQSKSNKSKKRQGDKVSILGSPEVDVEVMYRFVASRNVDFPREIAEAFYNVGLKYGIRGDIALCQSILETGWFKFTGGTAVTIDQNNFCGLGVTRLGLKGHSFNSIEEGVTAQMQHLYAYACKDRLPSGEKLIDPRFSKVTRGIAPNWNDLNRRWAANDHYSDRILALFLEMAEFVEEDD